MHKIAVMGDKDSILGFKAIGFDIYPTTGSKDEKAGLLNSLAEDGYALIYITEDTAVDIMDEISRYRSSYFPAIILIPGSKGSLGIGKRFVKESIEKAVGADILAHNE
ncbi:MAG TPA: V-type ATP synthase subunit F [Clostridiaceae bacterium]|jgi:V/A-type H+-transporting ATPase subunit F|nr:V-type ATP synthase subunit F [Clostridiaceae bacterium]